ncbi:uncharacterized protein LOC111624610 [Centruroides sculpturatus]|uniref:uncharacterized protein LOC111624610 n=1 Tax=Centruroides sculpturatus TaxID=218467 RepID=UPI000C6D3658|nr:uncharacterized protein LOC111624610 [Centruroides sculpturatus]XP_023223277.1 uncharacterized protein LOC111624610 [Centruroides sculpturatus]
MADESGLIVDITPELQRNQECKSSPQSVKERHSTRRQQSVQGRILPVPTDVGVASSSSCHSLSNQSTEPDGCETSAASSINDLTFEAEQLERAVRHNDLCYVRRMLELHHGRFPVNLHGSLLDKSSCETKSHCVSQDVDILLRKSQTFLDRLDRNDSVSTEQETPPIFANALHLAVEYNSQDVARLLLKYGVDPNECGVGCNDMWRRSSYTGPTEGSPAEIKGRRFSQLLTPATARHYTDGRSSPVFLPRQLVHMRRDIADDLRVVSIAPDGRPLTYEEVYSRDVLYALPPLFLAVVLGNPGMVHVLLKYNSSPNFQDRHGVTPLHLSACVERTPCLRLLLESGGRLHMKNHKGITPHDLADQNLAHLQQALIDEAVNSFVSDPITDDDPLMFGIGCKHTLFRRFQDSKYQRHMSRKKDYLSVDEAARGSPEGVSCSSYHSSLHSRHSNRSIQSVSVSHGEEDKSNSVEKNHEEVNHRISHKKNSTRSQATITGENFDLRVSRAENSLHVLSKMATNPECLLSILNSLQCHLSSVIELCDHVDGTKLHKPIAILMNQLLQTIVEEHHRRDNFNVDCLTAYLGRFLYVILGCLRGGHSLQYTSLLLINKIIDATIQNGITHYHINSNNLIVNVNGVENKSWTIKKEDEWKKEKSILEILTDRSIDLILNVLNNAITLHKRVVGTRQHCTPSRRWRNCNYHCLQILSARAILYLSQAEEAQKKLLEDGHLKIIIAALDSTHDPQLLCLVLQVVATLALEPDNHTVLIDNDLADCLIQLVLPSDEWYYTNHSTKYARFVKHHAARVLVYLGLEQRLKNKVYLFDLLEEPTLPTTALVSSEEDNYIVQTSLPPSVVVDVNGKCNGISVETVVMEMVKDVEVRSSP